MFEKIIGLFFLILGLGLFLMLTYIGYDNQKVNLNDYRTYENIVTEKGTGLRYDNRKKNSKVFYVKIKDLDKKVGVYRMFKNYDKLLNDINIGDKLKVYYKPNNYKKENINIDVIQIEKGKNVILNKDEYQTKYRILMIMGILASLYMILMIFSLLKYGKVENGIPTIF